MKTNNKKLFDMYDKATDLDYSKINSNSALYHFWRLYCEEPECFTDRVGNFDEAVRIANEIAKDELVEFVERKCSVRFVGVKDGYLDLVHGEFYIAYGNPHIGFTREYLEEHWTDYDRYNTAGLLKFEEVEDDSCNY